MVNPNIAIETMLSNMRRPLIEKLQAREDGVRAEDEARRLMRYYLGYYRTGRSSCARGPEDIRPAKTGLVGSTNNQLVAVRGR